MGIVIAPRGRLLLAVTVAIEGEQITGYELIADPVRLRQLDLAVLDKPRKQDPVPPAAPGHGVR